MTATLPPLLALAQGRAIRPRKGPLVRAKELLASLLKRQARPDWRWTHFPAGEARDKRQAAKLKAMGLRPGWPDFLLLPPSGLLHCLELKRQDEDLSDEQGEFFQHCQRGQIPYVSAWTLKEAAAALRFWGVLQ